MISQRILFLSACSDTRSFKTTLISPRRRAISAYRSSSTPSSLMRRYFDSAGLSPRVDTATMTGSLRITEGTTTSPTPSTLFTRTPILAALSSNWRLRAGSLVAGIAMNASSRRSSAP